MHPRGCSPAPPLNPRNRRAEKGPETLPYQRSQRPVAPDLVESTRYANVRVTVCPCVHTTPQAVVFLSLARPPQKTPYTWRISHAKWNLLRKIEHGNTTTTPKVAADLRLGHKIAVWWQGPGPANSRWYTARVLTAEVKNGVLTHTVLYDSDKSRRWTHALMPQSRQPATGDFSRWIPAPPTSPLPAPDVAAPREAARAPR